jgi:hypothetical protein
MGVGIYRLARPWLRTQGTSGYIQERQALRKSIGERPELTRSDYVTPANTELHRRSD